MKKNNSLKTAPATPFRVLLILLLIAGIGITVPSNLYKTTTSVMPQPASYPVISNKLQQQATQSLRTGIDQTKAVRGCVVVLDAHTGAIKASVTLHGKSHPQATEDMVVGSAWEPGSVMKPIVVATALNENTINAQQTTFSDTGETYVKGYRMTNALPNDPRTITIQDVITESINTGAINVLRSLGGEEHIGPKARTTYHQYLTDRFQFSRLTGAGIPGETAGYVASPTVGNNLEVQYANMAFGQGMTVTPIQFVSAYAAMLNGGNYYRPTTGLSDPQLITQNIISEQTSQTMRQLLKTAYEHNNQAGTRTGFAIGGKTGTAHVASPVGEYYAQSRDNGAYIGYVSKNGSDYVMLVRLDEPETHGFASALAREVWIDVTTKMIDQTGSFIGE